MFCKTHPKKAAMILSAKTRKKPETENQTCNYEIKNYRNMGMGGWDIKD